MTKGMIRVEEAGLLILVVVAGVAASNDGPKRVGLPPTSSVVRPVRGAQERTVFLVVRQGERTYLSEQRVTIPAGVDPQIAAIEFQARPGGALPRGTRVRSLTLDKEGLLHVDLNAAFIKNFAGGSTGEALTLAALSATVARFPGVKSFLVTVEGKPLTSLGGHVEWDQPQPASTTLPEDFRP